MDIRLKREDLLNSVKADLESRSLVMTERTAFVVLINGTEVTGDFLVEVRDIDLPSKSQPQAQPVRAPRRAPKGEPEAASFSSEPTKEVEDLSNPFGESAVEEGTENDPEVEQSIADGLDNGGEDVNDLSDFSDDKNLQELLKMMAPEDRKKAVARKQRQDQGHSLTRAPTQSRVYNSLKDAGKEAGEIGDEI